MTFLLFACSPVVYAQSGSFADISKRAEQARLSDNSAEAIHLYLRGVKLQPTWTDGWWWLGSLFYEQDRFPDAAPAFKKFVSLSLKPGPGYAFLALCEYETRDFASSLRHFQDWKNRGSPGNDSLLDVAGFHWALLLIRERRFNDALFLLTAKAQKLGDVPALVEAIGLASLQMPDLPEAYPQELRERVWLAGKAGYYSALGQAPRVNSYADRLLRRYPSAPNVHYFRGTLFAFQGDFSSAAEEYAEELKLSPQHVPALTELALAKINEFHSDEALPLAQRAVAADPQNARAHYALGRAFLESSKFSDSARELESARQLAPESSVIRFSLAKAYKALGRDTESKSEYAVFLKLQKQERPSAEEPALSRSERRVAEPRF